MAVHVLSYVHTTPVTTNLKSLVGHELGVVHKLLTTDEEHIFNINYRTYIAHQYFPSNIEASSKYRQIPRHLKYNPLNTEMYKSKLCN